MGKKSSTDTCPPASVCPSILQHPAAHISCHHLQQQHLRHPLSSRRAERRELAPAALERNQCKRSRQKGRKRAARRDPVRKAMIRKPPKNPRNGADRTATILRNLVPYLARDPIVLIRRKSASDPTAPIRPRVWVQDHVRAVRIRPKSDVSWKRNIRRRLVVCSKVGMKWMCSPPRRN